MKIQIKGINDVFERLSIELSKAETTHLRKTASKMTAELKAATPVDTGLARDSWKIDEQGKRVIVSNDTPYIQYLNEGSSKQAPSHFVEKVALKYGTPLGAITESK